MPEIITYKNTISQAPISYYDTIALNKPRSIVSGMTKETKNAIAERQRQSIQKIRKIYNLDVAPWCRKAGITEGALRNFLNGINGSMTSDNLEMLANAVNISVGELLGSDMPNKTQNDGSLSIIKALVETLILTQKMKKSDLELMLNHRLRELRPHVEKQDEAEAMNQFLDFVHSVPSGSNDPIDHKSPMHLPVQSKKEKN